MVWNVFFQIIPGQKQMVDEIRAGREPDPTPGIVGKQRSVHNTYFTLPVLFIMISNHYPMTYSQPTAGSILAVIMLAGALIRQFFVLRHKAGRCGCCRRSRSCSSSDSRSPCARASCAFGQGAGVPFAQVKAVLDARCLSCHATNPTQPGFAQPPKGVVLETPEQIGQHAAKIAETIANRYMPIGNLTQMTDEERAIVAAWFAQGAKH